MIYIANDVESAGGKLGIHSTLSIGAAVITPEKIAFNEYWDRGLVFYAELKPTSWNYEKEAMVVGCSQLICLEEIKRRDPKYDTASSEFSSMKVLELMESNCE